jgi:hypothetical protein
VEAAHLLLDAVNRFLSCPQLGKRDDAEERFVQPETVSIGEIGQKGLCIWVSSGI